MPIKNLAVWTEGHGNADAMFDGASPVDPDKRWAPIQALKRLAEADGGWCHTQDICQAMNLVPDAVIFLDVPYRPVDRLLGPWSGKVRKCLILQECEVIVPRNWDIALHEQFDIVFTWNPTLVDGRRYFHANLPNAFPSQLPPAGQMREKFCAMIAANKRKSHPLELYSERYNTIKWFESNHPEEFDLYGVGWDRHTFSGPLLIRALNRCAPLTRLLAHKFPSYRGMVTQKRPVLERYKFSICYENARDIPGYITEKIFDCFFAGCIPVYWGAPDIAEWVPKDCFIDRREFDTHEALYAYMKAMSPADYSGKQQAIAAYLSGRKAVEFSGDFFAEKILGTLKS